MMTQVTLSGPIQTIPFVDFPDDIKEYIRTYLVVEDLFVLGHVNGFVPPRTTPPDLSAICCYHAKGGHLSVVKWLDKNYKAFCQSKRYDLDAYAPPLLPIHQPTRISPLRRRFDWDVDLYCGAAAGGHLDVLEWLMSNGYRMPQMTLAHAADAGKLDVLKWAKKKGLQLNTEKTSVRWGHLDVLRSPDPAQYFPMMSDCMYVAARSGHIHVLEWGKENGASMTTELTKAASEGGILDSLKWCIANGCKCADNWVMCNSAAKGYLDMFMWYTSEGFPKDTRACSIAAENGHLDILKYATSAGYTLDSNVCRIASGEGHLEVVKWAKDQGCDWDKRVCYSAARSGHAHVLNWAMENGCDWEIIGLQGGYGAIYSSAVLGGHFCVLERFKADDAKIVAWEICPRAASDGQLSVLQYAREAGHPWDHDTCDRAVCEGHIDILIWAIENGCPFYTDVLYNKADWCARTYPEDATRYDILDFLKLKRSVPAIQPITTPHQDTNPKRRKISSSA